MVDEIICEDTRRAALLLNHYGIKKPLNILNDFNEQNKITDLISKLKTQNLALISDAGTPLISDPGYKLVRECLNQGIEVDSLPGPSSVLTALTLSGLPTDKFLFLGYLPDKPGHRLDSYRKILGISKIQVVTFILFLSPYKIIKTLTEMTGSLGDIELTLAHELTKIHQSVDSKPISSWLDFFKSHSPKGEYIALFRLT